MSALHVVVGAGPLGSEVAALLADRGEQVRVVRRAGASRVAGVHTVAGDITDAEFARQALAGASVVFQCAQPRYHRWPQEFETLQNRILDAAAATQARVVIADNLYAYGDPRGAVIGEHSPREPHTVKGLLRKRMAEAALADDRIEVALSRPSNYIGPDYAVFGSAVVRPALRGRAMQFLGSMDVAHSFSYIPDSAAAMVALAYSDRSWGRGWITPVLEPVTQSRLASLVWTAAGGRGEPRTSVMGPRLAAVLGVVAPDLGALREMWFEFEHPYVVDSGEFEREFGLTPTPIDVAVQATVQATVESFRQA